MTDPLKRAYQEARRSLTSIHKHVVGQVAQPIRQIKAMSKPPEFGGCNARVAELLREQSGVPLLEPLRTAFFEIYDTASHPLHDTLKNGRKHWFDPSFKLNDIALNCGRAALAERDLAASRQISTYIQITGSQGPAVMRFLANCAAAEGEWGAAETFYRGSKLPDAPLVPNARNWLHKERCLRAIRTMLDDIGVDWIDLNTTRPISARVQALTVWWQSLIRTGQMSDDRVAPVLRAIADLQKNDLNDELCSPAAADAAKMSMQNFRNYLSGKSVCLVANSQLLQQHDLGKKIDSYDVVMRFNSFVIDPPHTGSRTDVHVAVHLYHYNLDVPVHVRILVSGKRDLWLASLHEKIRPGCQTFLGDGSLSWPARNLGLLPENGPTPTVGFNMLRTLDHLNVNPVIDLIGFDFYASGMYRVQDALSVPHSQAHNSTVEKEWILSNARKVTDTIISLR